MAKERRRRPVCVSTLRRSASRRRSGMASGTKNLLTAVYAFCVGCVCVCGGVVLDR